MSKFLAAGLLAGSLIFPTSTASADSVGTAAAIPAMDSVSVKVVTMNGSGCPQGTAKAEVYPDGNGFRLFYADFVAQDGGGAPPTDVRKNCQVNLQVEVPEGYTYAVTRMSYRGYAHLARGAVGTQKSSTYFSGLSQTEAVQHTFKGPMADHWSVVDEVPAYLLQFAPCGEKRNLNINTELRVFNDSASERQISYMSMETSSARISSDFDFKWRVCS